MIRGYFIEHGPCRGAAGGACSTADALPLLGLQDGIQLRILDPVTPENKGQHILEEVERLEAVAKDSNLTMRLANRAGAFADYELAGGHPYDGWRLQYWKEVGRELCTSVAFAQGCCFHGGMAWRRSRLKSATVSAAAGRAPISGRCAAQLPKGRCLRLHAEHQAGGSGHLTDPSKQVLHAR
jgi:hypothetical protein